MAYAIFYNMSDLVRIAQHMEAVMAGNYDQYLTTQERNTTKQTFQRAWTGGLSGWQTAPTAIQQYPQYCDQDTDCRIITVTGTQVSKATLITACNLIGTKPALIAAIPPAAFMAAVARDLSGTCVEPWP